MRIARRFNRETSARQLVAVLDNVAAHLAAKLECFGSDERTLSEELVDMLCVWSSQDLGVPGGPVVDLHLHKVSQSEEARTGADLELILTTPSGSKRALFQAKVVDEGGHRIRGQADSIYKLRQQLKLARRSGGDLAAALFYVPMGELDGARYGIGTWEQEEVQGSLGSIPARYGATVIPASDLMNSSGRYKRRPGVRFVSGHGFVPAGRPLSTFVLEMLLCKRGQWAHTQTKQNNEVLARVRVAAALGLKRRQSWPGFLDMASALYEEFGGS